MLHFFLQSCMLGHCFQLHAVNDSPGYPGFVALLLHCPTNLKAMMWHLFFFLYTTSTVPNPSILFTILYARASLLPEVVDFSGYPSLIAFCQSDKLESDDVAFFFFLSTTSTIPNPSILFAILYARAFLSAEVVSDSPGYR